MTWTSTTSEVSGLRWMAETSCEGSCHCSACKVPGRRCLRWSMHSMTVSPSCYELWLYFAHWNWLFYPEDSSNEDRNLPAAGTQIEAVLQEINWTRTAAVCAGVMSPDLCFRLCTASGSNCFSASLPPLWPYMCCSAPDAMSFGNLAHWNCKVILP